MNDDFNHILITGGAGYVGSLLTPQLLDLGYKVSVYDILYFGDHFLPKQHPNLSIIEGDIRDTSYVRKSMQGVDAVIALGCISNDASFELDKHLSTSVNRDAFEPLVIAAKASGVKRFIYASSSSVYGVSDSPDVTEDHPLVPLTLYNRFKGECEPFLFKHMDEDFTCVTIRPATICGYAPRQRLDLTVNILTNYAVNCSKITVFGGSQLRPNLHIQDMCDVYKLLLTVPKDKISGQTFNVGYQNKSINDIAEIVKKMVENYFPDKGTIEIVRTETNDIRSYHINSDKINKCLDFKPKHTIEEAVQDLCRAFKAGALPNSFSDDWYYNVRQLKALAAA